VCVNAVSRTTIVPIDYPTVTAAIGNATAGDTIVVKNGEYNETALEINKPLTIMSEHPYQARISLNPSQYPLHYRDQNLNTTYYVHNNPINIKADNVKLSGFIITSPGGLVSAFGNHLQITNNIMGSDAWLTGSGTNATVEGASLLLRAMGSNGIVADNRVIA
jgi:hypothetical protein